MMTLIQKLNEEYHKGTLGEFQIVIHTKTKHVNVSKLCKDYKKDFNKWKELKSSKKLIAIYYQKWQNLETPREHDGESDKTLGGMFNIHNNDYAGTYCAVEIAIQVAQWLSPEFAINVSRIIGDYYSQTLELENKSQKSEIERLMNLIKENEIRATIRDKTLNDKIDKLSAHIEKIYKSQLTKDKTEEVLVVYTEEDDEDNVIRIRVGKYDYINNITKSSHTRIIFKNIINSKEAIKFCKDKMFLHRNNSCKYEMDSNDKCTEIIDILKGLDDKCA